MQTAKISQRSLSVLATTASYRQRRVPSGLLRVPTPEFFIRSTARRGSTRSVWSIAVVGSTPKYPLSAPPLLCEHIPGQPGLQKKQIMLCRFGVLRTEPVSV